MDSGGLKLSGRVLGSLKTEKSKWSSIGPFVPPLFWDTRHKKALGIGVCIPCGCFGVLSATCSYRGQRPYTNLIIVCVNPKVGSEFRNEEESHNELWYNAVQRSFL